MIYGYGCISSGFMPRKDPEAIKKTKAYQSLKNMFIAEDSIYIDIITANYRTRTKLKKIIQSSNSDDCVVIASISALGTTNDEILNNYLEIYNKNIGLLIPDYNSPITDNLDVLSTADWSMKIKNEYIKNGEEYPESIIEKINKIKTIKIKTNQGRAFQERPENFETIYWLYENYFLSETDTYDNKLLKIGKKLFRRLAEEYETTDPNYYLELCRQDELYKISEKPKRHGKVPDDFPTFLNLIDNGLTIDDAAKKMNYNMMNPIDFKRYQIKYLGGKKSMAVANELRKSELAIELTKNIIKDKQD